jgi:hypothetical protein
LQMLRDPNRVARLRGKDADEIFSTGRERAPRAAAPLVPTP